MTEQHIRTVSLLWDFLLQLPPNLRHDALAQLRERLERMPAMLLNEAVMTRSEVIEETFDRR